MAGDGGFASPRDKEGFRVPLPTPANCMASPTGTQGSPGRPKISSNTLSYSPLEKGFCEPTRPPLPDLRATLPRSGSGRKAGPSPPGCIRRMSRPLQPGGARLPGPGGFLRRRSSRGLSRTRSAWGSECSPRRTGFCTLMRALLEACKGMNLSKSRFTTPAAASRWAPSP
ncbi:MAG: hypothetical protein XD60_1438 [Acetothermia bacterium 64_32]|nr:MAG: hypothetical protein XD60_1438 [Acetothermia bacterium 64_32]